jgi:hypothetical protein
MRARSLTYTRPGLGSDRSGQRQRLTPGRGHRGFRGLCAQLFRRQRVGGYSDFSRVQTPLSSCAHSGASNKKRFFVDEKIHPQTKALIDTHAECVRFSVCSLLSAVYRTSLEPRS